jgi:divinyl chlorophyllide a 8-vinyl-reductase
MAKNILLFGATGTIGRAVLRTLQQRGHHVVAFARSEGATDLGVEIRRGSFADPDSLSKSVFQGAPFDVVLSCMASRNGVPQDAWDIDYQAHVNVLKAARTAAAGHFILLSSICVQRPLLAFQQAKLAFETDLIASGMRYSIIRPTAYFKSLSGQVERVLAGKRFLLFGDGDLTACKPISDDDLAEYIADCINDNAKHDRILPIGGPGEAVTPRQQGEMLFKLAGQPPRFRKVPLALFDAIGAGLRVAALVSKSAAKKAELARIGRYYATESMLWLDPETGRYDPEATPSTGSTTLADHYAKLIAGEITVERGEHSVF